MSNPMPGMPSRKPKRSTWRFCVGCAVCRTYWADTKEGARAAAIADGWVEVKKSAYKCAKCVGDTDGK